MPRVECFQALFWSGVLGCGRGVLRRKQSLASTYRQKKIGEVIEKLSKTISVESKGSTLFPSTVSVVPKKAGAEVLKGSTCLYVQHSDMQIFHNVVMLYRAHAVGLQTALEPLP